MRGSPSSSRRLGRHEAAARTGRSPPRPGHTPHPGAALTSAAGAGSVAFDRSHTDDLIAFLQASPRLPRGGQCGGAAGEGGLPAGRGDRCLGGHGRGRYLIRGGALIAWYVPEEATAATPFRIVGAHTDSPNLRVKPVPDTGSVGWRQVAMEIYGGVPLNTGWTATSGSPGGSPCVTAAPAWSSWTSRCCVFRSCHPPRPRRQRGMTWTGSAISPRSGAGRDRRGLLIEYVARAAELDRRRSSAGT